LTRTASDCPGDMVGRVRFPQRCPLPATVARVSAYFDNVVILQVLDRMQQQRKGQPLMESAHDLMREVTGAYPADTVAEAGFLQEMIAASAAGLLTWRLMDQTVPPTQVSYYLQQMRQLALTVEGQDRARNRIVELPPPEPGEDDGHDLSDLILRRVAEAISAEYAPDQAETFLHEQGIPPDWLELSENTGPGDIHGALAATWRTGSLGRRPVRAFLGRWLDEQLITGPDAELRATLIEQLARQGWQIRPDDSMLVAAEPVRGIPVSAPFLREARLHPLIEAEARPQFMIRKLDQAVFASMKAVEVRVRKLAGLGEDLVGVKLMTRAFGPGGQLADPATPPGEQDGTRAMFAGAFAVLRNPAGHREVDYRDVSEAAEAVQTASLLMRILDRAEARLVAAGRTVQSTVQPSPTP
jgi:uncharacterized protein (TIGR02391 family)